MPRKHLINNFIEQNNISCSLFVESKIDETHNVNYNDWTTFTKIGHKIQNIRGGSIIQCHPSLHARRDNPPAIRNQMNEVTHFTTPFQNEKLHIFLVYFHPNSTLEETVFTKASLYKYSIIIGDFNATTKKKLDQINEFVKNSKFSKAETGPTFIMSNNQDSTPDLLLYTENIKSNIVKVELIPDLAPDHLGMVVDIDMQLEPHEQTEKITYNYKLSNILKINKELELFIENNENTPFSEQYIEDFNRKLSETIRKHTPVKKRHIFLHELPPYIIKLIKHKRKIYREYCKNPNPHFKKELNNYNKNIQRMIQQYRENNWIAACNKINELKGKNFYNEVKKLSKYKQFPNIPNLIENNKEYITDQEKAQLFAEHYVRRYKFGEDDNYDKNAKTMIDEWYKKYFSNQIHPRERTTLEHADYYQQLHNSKNSSPGKDNIPWIILKRLDEKIHLHIIKIFEFCINEGIFPEIWKTGQIINIPKSNSNKQRVGNYRPITLLPVLGKLYEKVIKTMLTPHIEQHIPNFQFGFRKERSTIHPLTILVSNAQNATLKSYKTSAISLDIEKAFDSIWHKALLYKLYKLGVPTDLIKLCKQFLENRKLEVKVGTSTSDYFCPEQGTPQGSPLSTLLFNIFCHDIILETSNDLYILQFADDTILITHAKTVAKCVKKLQDLLEYIQNWFKKWRMKINIEKSQFIIFDHRISTTSPTLQLEGKTIQPAASIKYLGVQIDNKLNFNLHTKNLKKKAISRAKHFSKLTYRKQGISTITAAKIYKTICRPLIEYAHPIFNNCKRPAVRNIEVAETKALRTITRMRHPNNVLYNPPNDLLYSSTNIEPIRTRLNTLLNRFVEKLRRQEDVLALYQDELNHSSSRKHPRQTLYNLFRI